MTRTTANRVTTASQDVARAEQQLADAQQALEDARNRLDAAFAERGWKRVGGVFSPGLRYYTHALYPNATLDATAVAEALRQMEAA
jgi:hypothetical protein